MLRPGAEMVARFGGLGTLRRLGRPDAHRLRRVPGVLARPEGRRRRRHVPQHLRRLDAPLHAGGGGRAPRSCSAPTSRWCSTCARRCRARPTVVAPRRRAHRGVGGAGPCRPPPRDDQALFGIVQGGVDVDLRRRERRAHGRRSTSTATASAGCQRGRDPRRDAAGARRRHRRTCPADRPRYLMGVGDPASLVEAVALGVDQFDCVHADPPRPPRHGADRAPARLHVKAARHAAEDEPARPDVPLRGVRPPQPGLPAPPVPRRRADRLPAGQPAQRRLDARPDRPRPAGDRRRHASTRSARDVLAVWG